MSTGSTGSTMHDAQARLARLPPGGSFIEAELEDLAEPVRRYLAASILPGTPLARSARFWMRGAIKLGRRWVPFRAAQIISPLHGFVWSARVAGFLVGSDRYADGCGAMEWKLLGLIRLVHAEGPEVSRSSAGRVGAETVWVPTALLPRFGLVWNATEAHRLTASYRLDDTDLELHYTLDDDARVRSVALARWGDPENSGTWARHRFEHRLIRHSTFDGVTIPSAGRAAWLIGTAGWDEGEFFRYEITDYHLVA